MNNERDCPHGRQRGKCADCDVIELEAQADRDTALLRQCLDELMIPSGGRDLNQMALVCCRIEGMLRAALRERLEGKA